MRKHLYLDGEDLDSHIFIHHLSLPDAAETPPSFHLEQLQRLETQQGGGRRWTGVLEDTWRAEHQHVTFKHHIGLKLLNFAVASMTI